eukprot:CAMPEP_0183768864 /NCGR_PEP_ID=MMETSP0739-20130205/19008_1 /TAXON_ID=385413 /ORGANISM="Thalassiosira miniscula, Strain CCMP1093" /LENGTH=44 /DNA_ID= /DNA_START= /DNA_END= /DNA_ORIENTATION=
MDLEFGDDGESLEEYSFGLAISLETKKKVGGSGLQKTTMTHMRG